MEVSNEKLASLNNISEQTFVATCQEFRQHTQTLLTMKKQLDSCFRRIRSLKSKLATQYPEAYESKGGTVSKNMYLEPSFYAAAVAKCQLDIEDDNR